MKTTIQPRRDINGPDSRNEGFDDPTGKEPQSAEVLAEDIENTEWVVEESSYKKQLQPCDQLQKRGLKLS